MKKKLMTLSSHSALVAGLALCVLPGGASGQAEESSDAREDARTLDTVVVVGAQPEFLKASDATSVSKFEVDIQDTPQSVSVLTEDFIRTANVLDLEDASRFVPGLTEKGPRGFGEPRSDFFARGTQLGLDRSFKLDNNSFAFQGILDTVGIERIEFVRGPASIAYGIVDYGGIVNVITKKPQKEFSASAVASYASWDNLRVEGDVTGSITGDGSVRYRLGVGYRDGDDFRDGGSENVLTITPALQVDLAPNLLLSVNGYLQESESVASGAIPVLQNSDSGEIVLPSDDLIPRDTFGANPDSFADNEIQAIATQLRYEPTEDTELRAAFNYSRSKFNVRNAYIESYYGPVQFVPSASPYGYVYTYTQINQDELEVLNAELSVQHDFEAFGQEHKVFALLGYEDYQRADGFGVRCTGGVNVFDFEPSDISTEFLTIDELVNQTGNFCFGDGDVLETQNTNIGAQGQFYLTDKLSLILGARYDSIDALVINSDAALNKEQALVLGSIGFDDTTEEVTLRAGAVYELTDQINVYGLFVDGFTPSFANTRNNGVVDNEQGVLFEVGVKGLFLDDALAVNASVFQLDISDTPISDPENGPGDDFVIPGGEAERSGVELEVIGQLNENLSLSVNYAYIDGQITEAPDDPFLVGRDLAIGPTQSFSTFLSYTFTTNDRWDGLNLGASISYADEQTPSVNVDYKLPSYTLVDLRASYPIRENIEIGLNIQNVLDEEYLLASGSDWGVNYGEPQSFFGFIRAVF